MMSENVATYILPPTLKFDACADLHAFVAAHYEKPIIIDGSNVERINGLAIQMLAYTAKKWGRENIACTFENLSDTCKTAFTTLGLEPTTQGAA